MFNSFSFIYLFSPQLLLSIFYKPGTKQALKTACNKKDMNFICEKFTAWERAISSKKLTVSRVGRVRPQWSLGPLRPSNSNLDILPLAGINPGFLCSVIPRHHLALLPPLRSQRIRKDLDFVNSKVSSLWQEWRMQYLTFTPAQGCKNE